MRTGRDARGRARVWYDFDEIEQLAAATLRAAGRYPAPAAGPIPIDEVLESHLGASVDYGGDLAASVLGYTEFRTPPRVVISRSLTDLATAAGAPLGIRGRWRATLAHETAHVVLHASLFSERSSGRDAVRCERDAIEVDGRAADWVEVQANMGMAALLMPRAAFVAEARRLLEAEGPAFPPLSPSSARAAALAARLAETFEASLQASTIRLRTFGFVEV